ncbi:hypothetical protein B1M_15795 [Burkholderia sp. TJI49]|nr:hypothetical protein B1M_15795 [Burkholderia sp. TJI49]
MKIEGRDDESTCQVLRELTLRNAQLTLLRRIGVSV